MNHASSAAFDGLGMVCLHTSRKEEAIDWFKKAIKADPSNSSPYINIVDAATTLKEINDVDTFFGVMFHDNRD